MDISLVCRNAREASKLLLKLDTSKKNNVLIHLAKALVDNIKQILIANEKDIAAAKLDNKSVTYIDKISINESKIIYMANTLSKMAGLNDPVGEYIASKTLSNGLSVNQVRVPVGVISIVYETNIALTCDAFGLCFKAGNAVILKGGKEIINTNKMMFKIFQSTLKSLDITKDAVQLVTDTSKEALKRLLKQNETIDLVIPSGCAELVSFVVDNSTIPVIKTGSGNCHIFIDETADIKKAIDIIINSKTQSLYAANSCETLLVCEAIAKKFLPQLGYRLSEKKVEAYGDEVACKLMHNAIPTTEMLYQEEFLDLKLSIIVVKDVDEAIDHVNQHGSNYTEAIITDSYINSKKFLNLVDSACVFVNASTRFCEGEELGIGTDIGVSTQKFHSRGPVCLKDLTTTKYVVFGDGQIRLS